MRGLTQLSRAISTIKQKLSRKHDEAAPAVQASETRRAVEPSRQLPPATARAPRREPDIPIDQVAAKYNPTQTSLKTSFRATGQDQSRDQEFARGVADDRWNDEDHFTNRSGDPRIGTHGRSYEPDEGKERMAADFESE